MPRGIIIDLENPPLAEYIPSDGENKIELPPCHSRGGRRVRGPSMGGGDDDWVVGGIEHGRRKSSTAPTPTPRRCRSRGGGGGGAITARAPRLLVASFAVALAVHVPMLPRMVTTPPSSSALTSAGCRRRRPSPSLLPFGLASAATSSSAFTTTRYSVRDAVPRARGRGGSMVASSATGNYSNRSSSPLPGFFVRRRSDAATSSVASRGLVLTPPSSPSLRRFPLRPIFASSSGIIPSDDGGDEGADVGIRKSSSSSRRRMQMRMLEEEIYELNGGIEFNLRSPRQISEVIFPEGGANTSRSSTSTSRDALMAFIEGGDDDGDGVVVNGDHSSHQFVLGRRRAIAARVLEWRSIRSSTTSKKGGGQRGGARGPRGGLGRRGASSSPAATSERRGVAGPSLGSSAVTATALAAANATTTLPGGRPRRRLSAAFSSDASGGGTVVDGDVGCCVGVGGAASGSDSLGTGGRERHRHRRGDDASSSSAAAAAQSSRPHPSPPGGGGHGHDDRYARHVRSLFFVPPSSVGDDDERSNWMDVYWMDVLLERIDRPSARDLVYQLDPRQCPMGYDPNATPSSRGDGYVISTTTPSGANRAPSQQGKRGTLLGYVRSEKSSRFPTSVMLVRVGEFYEAYGLDAILLVQFCGLNPMGGKARAGCPYRNIQMTLNGLTDAGFNVAVYEEADGGVGSGRRGGSRTAKLKERMLAQLVTPASPTYLYDLVLGGGNGGGGAVDATADALSSPSPSCDPTAPPPRPHVGVIHSSRSGYTIVEVSLEERSVRVSERVTAEAVSCRISAYPPADPIFYVPTPNECGGSNFDARNLPFLPAARRREGSCSAPRTKIIPPHLVETPQPGGGRRGRKSDVEIAKDAVVSALLRTLDVGVCEGSDEPSAGVGTRAVSVDDFVLVASSCTTATDTDDDGPRCGPLHRETASQLGLLTKSNEGDPTVPCLVSSLLPPGDAPAASRRFLRRWLLIPPPPSAADAMRTLVRSLKGEGDLGEDGDGGRGRYYEPRPLPPLHVPSLGGVLSLLRAGQASAGVFRELVRVLDATATVLGDGCDDDDDGRRRLQHDRMVVRPLVALVEYESGMSAEPNALRQGCVDTMEEIGRVVLGAVPWPHEGERPSHHLDEVTDLGDLLPRAFLERNELSWRGRVHPEAAGDAYDRVERAAARLADAVAEDYWGLDSRSLNEEADDGDYDSDVIANRRSAEGPAIVQDIFNNIIALKEVPSWAKNDLDDREKEKYYHPRDRNGKILRNRYTTQNVDDAMSGYLDACDDARRAVASALTGLSDRLCDGGYLPHVVRASHANLILATASRHAARANAAGWSVAASRGLEDRVQSATSPGEEVGLSSSDGATAAGPGPAASGRFVDVWPYWMDRTDAVPNTFTLDGMFVLTAPNMSGKSTLMRSTAAAALLTNCGLCAPLSGRESWVRRFDAMFVRGASADVPSEGRSAFGAEMGDVSAMLRCCTDRSLVFVDELGRGTSPRDGTTIAGAVVEAMATKGISGFFATHLHGILRLPLQPRATARIAKKRMAVVVDAERTSVSGEDETKAEKSREDYGWTYRMEDGVCTDSLAMLTAERFGLPGEILDRADEFSKLVSDVEIATSPTSSPPPADADVTSDEEESSSRSREAKRGPTSGQAAFDAVPAADGGGRAAAAVIEAVEQVSGGEVLYVPPRYTSPASFEGCACVYVLMSGNDDDRDRPSRRCRYYVGETESLSRRLSQHRAKGDEWSGMGAIVVKVEGGRTNARNVESRLIGHMARSGHDMISVADGRRTKPLGGFRQNSGAMDRLRNS